MTGYSAQGIVPYWELSTDLCDGSKGIQQQHCLGEPWWGRDNRVVETSIASIPERGGVSCSVCGPSDLVPVCPWVGTHIEHEYFHNHGPFSEVCPYAPPHPSLSLVYPHRNIKNNVWLNINNDPAKLIIKLINKLTIALLVQFTCAWIGRHDNAQLMMVVLVT